MTTARSPLVRLSTGKIAELPSGDSILGAPAGPSGPTGAAGAAGAAATVSVGTTTTLAAGTSATVTNAGTSSAAIFDFGIPQGATGPAGGMVQIAQIVASGTPSTITFSSIPGTYTNLVVSLFGRDTITGSSDLNVFLKINGDATAANYTATEGLFGTGSGTGSTSTASSTSGAFIAKIPGTSGDANALGVATITFPSYAATTFWKMVASVIAQNGGTLQNALVSFRWKSTSAITSLTLTAGGTAFANGTTATLYGLP